MAFMAILNPGEIFGEIAVLDGRLAYFGSQNVLRSTNQGNSWEAISPDLTRHTYDVPASYSIFTDGKSRLSRSSARERVTVIDGDFQGTLNRYELNSLGDERGITSSWYGQ